PINAPEGLLVSFPLDLHVLGLPPAFNLSHDQTLQFKILSTQRILTSKLLCNFKVITIPTE
ncbi:hypothetical protein PD716_20920, partial [Vibrio gigantis]|uniref:hypothetical protein n=1 Tax=Vibrio gigantis TaxID=296199 RepID=UPI002FC67EC1